MTQATLTQNLNKIRSSNIAGAKLITDLQESFEQCFWCKSVYSSVEYIRLRGNYPMATIKKVFAKLGVKVTHVNRKPGKREWKTIVHFTDISNPQ